VGLALLDNDRQPQFANRAKATALNGRARLIPLVQRISFGSRLTFEGIRRCRLRESNATRYQDYVGQASRRYRLAFVASLVAATVLLQA
jgi:hypothetical protein